MIGHKEVFVSVSSCYSVEDVYVHLCSKTSWVRQEWHTGS